MAFQRAGIDTGMSVRLREMAAQIREVLYGPGGCPEWGTQFREIEQRGMSVGLELARLVMEQSVQAQAEQVPDSAGVRGRRSPVGGAGDDAPRDRGGADRVGPATHDVEVGPQGFFSPSTKRLD